MIENIFFLERIFDREYIFDILVAKNKITYLITFYWIWFSILIIQLEIEIRQDVILEACMKHKTIKKYYI